MITRSNAMKAMKVNNIICGMTLLVITFYTTISLAKNNLQPMDQQIQNTINTYLNENKQDIANPDKVSERITAVSASIFLPQNSGLSGDTKNYYAGVIGSPPLNKPINRNNLFEIASITKSFVAAIILQLEAENKLSINDKLEKWLPEYTQWKDVTIKQLLSMTSGIPSYSKNPIFSDKLYRNIRSEWTDLELINLSYPDKPIVYSKNKFDYSNTNFILAGLIIEKITNDTLANQLQKRIFHDPKIKMNDTYYPVGKNWKIIQNEMMPRMVHGYYYENDTKRLLDLTNNNLSWGAAAGGIVSTTADITRWVQTLYNGTLFPHSARKTELENLKSVVSMKTGEPISTVTENDPYGFGLGVGYAYKKELNARFWFYEGSGLGYRMAYIWNACNNVSVTVALNNKAGESNPKAPEGDHIFDLAYKIYDEIVNANPQYRCRE